MASVGGVPEADAGTSESDGKSAPISSDRPIRTPDEDLFCVDPFAQMVARSIVGQRMAEGTVIAVNGPWGSGKSSVVNLVVHHLGQSAPEEIEVVPFNPWWFAGSPALARAFFSTVASALKRTLQDEGKAALEGLLGRLGSLNTYTETAARVAESGVAGGVAYFALGDRSLEEEHRKLAAALRNQDKSFLIVIDDIDRLNPDDALLIFGLVKSFGQLPKVTYLLAFDRLLIERLLEERFPSEGSEYLEKILQGVFDLPPTPPDMLREAFLGEVQGLFDVEEGEIVRFMNLFYDIVVPNLVTPRNVIRLAGSLRVTSPAVRGEVDPADFVAVETLRLFWPAVYRNIRDHAEVATEGIGTQAYGNEEQLKARVGAALLAGVEAEDQPYVKTALQRLFPRLEGVWSNVSYGPDWVEAWERARRVCSLRHLPTYFHYAVNANTLPSSLRDDLVAHAGDEAFIRQVLRESLQVGRPNGGTRAALVLEELRLVADDIRTQDLPALLNVLFETADELDRPEDRDRGFGFASNPRRLHWLLNKLVFDRHPIEEVSELLVSASRRSSPGWCADLAERCLRPYQPRESDQNREPADPVVTEAAAREIAEVALEGLRVAGRDGRLLASEGAQSMLWALYRLANEGYDEVLELTNSYLEDDAQTILLAKAVTSTTWSQGIGFAGMADRVARGQPRVPRSSLEVIVDVQRLRSRVIELLDRTDLSADSVEILERFLAGWDASETR